MTDAGAHPKVKLLAAPAGAEKEESVLLLQVIQDTERLLKILPGP